MKLYKITNKENGKAYIGITCKTVERRWTAHVRNASYGVYHNMTLAHAIRKYGAESFFVETIGEASSYEELLSLEIEAIKSHDTLVPKGYNISEGGDGFRGPRSAETCEKISKAHKGVKLSAYHKQRLSEAHKGQLAWNKGKTLSAEHRENLSKAKAGKPGQGWIKGRKRGPRPEEEKRRISETMKRVMAAKRQLQKSKGKYDDQTIH